jgi:hypothetical protein
MDPVLFGLQYGESGIFNLAQNLISIAIRDQMVRACLLADRLPAWLQARFGAGYKTYPILVVGGGACGLTAAVKLAQQGLQVVLVERNDQDDVDRQLGRPPYFDLQWHCESR